jgi:hypothetical protein
MMRVWLAASSLSLTIGAAHADGRCDLNELVGYTLVFGKPIYGYIQRGVRKPGYDGCETDRVLVFSDRTGVRCAEMNRQEVDAVPTGYLFARNAGDLKLCVEGVLFTVQQTN